MDGLLVDAQTVGDPPRRDKNRAAEDTAKRIETISKEHPEMTLDGRGGVSTCRGKS